MSFVSLSPIIYLQASANAEYLRKEIDYGT
nr:MAG TPA: hypothetical protein [Caudoviricetes sp.]DAN10875.1 MAG TPA: hypothetical protein [Caudoviricetes sp.]